LSTTDKYDLLADGFSEREYADPVGYSARRARVIAELGPRIEPGDTVLDVCCADGIMAAPLTELGLGYLGVDASENMLAAARRRNPGSLFLKGLMEEFVPHEQVDVTICMRSFYLADDQVAFFRHVGGYTRKKFVFDFWQSEHPADTVLRDLHLAGFSRVELRPFFTPQRRVVPGFLRPAVTALESTGPLALLLSRRVGCVFCSATV
jgi:SAM-dependent methyltransferase